MVSILDKKPVTIGHPILHCKADELGEVDLTYNSTVITASGNAGTNTIIVSSSAILKEGAFIALTTIGGEKNVIQTIVGNTITLKNNLLATHAATPLFTGGIGVFTDKSGNTNHLLQVAGASQPLLIEDYHKGRNALSFDGSNDYMTAAFSLKQPYSIYAVCFSGIGSRQFIFDGLNQSSWGRLYIDYSAIPSFTANAGVNMFNTTTNNTSNRFLAAVFNSKNSLSIHNFNQKKGDAGTLDADGITLGSHRELLGDFAAMVLKEIIVYPEKHSVYQVKKVLNKLKKYYA